MGTMAGAGKATELMFSLTETGWLSTGREGLSFPGRATAQGSVLVDRIGGCERGPTACWGTLAVVVVEL